MKLLYADIETAGPLELSKVGAFRYAEEARVLLFGYAVDTAPAKVWDVTSDPMPADLAAALNEVWKRERRFVMHNGMNFDSIILPKLLGHDIEPQSVIDTMVLAYEAGIGAASLGDLCTILGVPADKAKDRRGRFLVRRFCLPNKADGGYYGRKDFPEEWAEFVNYCRLDIEAMREVLRRLPKGNFTPWERKMQVLDAEINRRGICIDRTLAEQAVRLWNEEKERLSEEIARRTDGAVQTGQQRGAILQFFKDQYGVELTSLTKAEVAKRLNDSDLPQEVRDILSIRARASKNASAKYETALACLCKDNRVRGMLQFRGACRTGRFCLTGDHEVLTREGWVRLDEWRGGEIACWQKDESVEFLPAEAVCFPYQGPLVCLENKRISQLSTPEHNMACEYGVHHVWHEVEAKEFLIAGRKRFPYTGQRKVERYSFTNEQLRVLIMTQADGSYKKKRGTVTYHFTKKRKIERCQKLLAAADIEARIYEGKCGTYIDVAARNVPNWLKCFSEKIFTPAFFDANPEVFFEELAFWDSSQTTENSFQYSTCARKNAEFVQAFAHMSGRAATFLECPARKAEHSTSYAVNVWSNCSNRSELRIQQASEQRFDGVVYCARTQTGFFLVRRNNRVWVTGNSGRLIQLQNLPRPTMSQEDIEFAIETVKTGSAPLFFEDIGEVLNSCIRGLIVAPEGKKLIVADYSNIEGRVLAWLAGEDWKIQAFRDYDAGVGHDLYKLTYSRTFNVPVEEVTKAQRQMGKVLELALGYGGGAGAFATFAEAYRVDLHGMAGEVKHTVDPELWEEAERSYVTFFKPKGLTGGMDKDVFIACDAVKRAWRLANPRITSLWDELGKAVTDVLTEPKTVSVRGKLTVCRSGKYLVLGLPSGRKLYYPNARLIDGVIVFDGFNQYSRKWGKTETHSARLVENATQAIACDVLMEGMYALNQKGYPTVLSIHDEVILEVSDEPAYSYGEVAELMTSLPPWGKGLPLSVDGFEAKRYRK